MRVSVGQGTTAFYFGNNNQLQIDNMIFTGKNVPVDDPAFIDAQYVIFAGWVSLVKITNSSFFGIAVPNDGAIVNVASNLTIENCQFDGNNAGYPNGAVINFDCCALVGLNANIRNTTFNDYTHFNGQWYSKTFAFTGNWVRVKQVHWSGGTENQRLSIEDSFFDEGAAVAISAENIGSISVRGTRFNINGSDAGTGLRASNVTRVRIEDSYFGYSNLIRPLAILSDSSVEMIGVTRGNQVQCPQADAETTISWRLSDCN